MIKKHNNRNINKMKNVSNNSMKFGKVNNAMSFGRVSNNEINQPLSSSNSEIIQYNGNGSSNSFANFLIELKLKSPTHSSILQKKALYLIGNGIKYKNGDYLNDLLINPLETFNDFLSKIIGDLLISNYAFVEVHYNKFGQPLYYYHLPFNQVATNLNYSKYEFTPNGIFNSSDRFFYDPFEYTNHGDGKSRVFMIKMPSHSFNLIYPTPSYNSGIQDMITEIAISKFNNTNIQNNFTLSTIITSFNGTSLTDNQKQEMYDELSNLFTGIDGKKFLLDFQDVNGKAAEVQNVDVQDWSKNFEQIKDSVKDNIVMSHHVNSPLLFGVKTEGQLGGATEQNDAYNIWQNTDGDYIRNAILSNLHDLFKNSATISDEPLVWDIKKLVNESTDEQLKYMTINEIRQSKGLKPLDPSELAQKESKMSEDNHFMSLVNKVNKIKNN